MKREEIRIRDPFILVENNLYYMYGTTAFAGDDTLAAKNTFSVYTSKDLENFDGPYVIFDGGKGNFWGTYDYWAAEVWKYQDKYYLFGGVKSEKERRATQIFVSESPLGPFIPVSNLARTPREWECLDGTLWVEDGVPYMVFCHEWVQCEDGEVVAIRLSQDLSKPIGEPFVLFKASDNPYVEPFSSKEGENCRVTDGPFLYKENGGLHMIWSSMSNGRYVVLEARTKELKGKWEHLKPRFTFDGGHAMLFTDLQGKRFFALHHPNNAPYERAIFIPYERKEL